MPQHKTTGGKANLALPDDGIFPATTRAPALALNYSNAAPITSPQTHVLHETTGDQEAVQFTVPPATYSEAVHRPITESSQGAAALTITLSYAGGASLDDDDGFRDARLRAWRGALPNDPVLFNLIGEAPGLEMVVDESGGGHADPRDHGHRAQPHSDGHHDRRQGQHEDQRRAGHLLERRRGS